MNIRQRNPNQSGNRFLQPRHTIADSYDSNRRFVTPEQSLNSNRTNNNNRSVNPNHPTTNQVN